MVIIASVAVNMWIVECDGAMAVVLNMMVMMVEA